MKTSELKSRRKAKDYVRRLEKLISLSGLPDSEIETRLGWEPSQLREALRQSSSIRVEDILAILFAIDVEPAEFYSSLDSE